jgi:CPA2 family monovalent cation:H+ antiporter-2
LQRLNISPVLGFLLCGLVAGPYGVPAAWQALGFDFPAPIHDNAIIHTFGELGIMFLMFVIGLKLSWKDLWHMRRHIAGLGTCQILVTTLAVSAIAYAFGNPLALSILLGACFALSSTAVVMQLFEERRMVHSPVGKVSFSILLMQDLAVVPILTMLPILTGSGPDHIVMLMLKALLLAVAMIGGIYVIGVRVLGPLLRYLHPGDQPEWLMSFVLFLVIGTAMLTESAGLSSALGAFLAGVLLAETEYRDRIQTIIAPGQGIAAGGFLPVCRADHQSGHGTGAPGLDRSVDYRHRPAESRHHLCLVPRVQGRAQDGAACGRLAGAVRRIRLRDYRAGADTRRHWSGRCPVLHDRDGVIHDDHARD